MHEDTIDRLIAASRPTDAEIDAEFTPAARDDILARVVASSTVVPLRPRHRTRWLGLVAAGIVVAVGAMTVQALLPSRTVTVVTQGPSGPTTTTVTQPPIGLPVAMALEPVAQAAEQRPSLMPVGSGIYHVVMTETQVGESAGTVTHDMYVAADGWAWRKDVRPGEKDFWMLYHAAVEDYSTLPADPVALDALLRSRQGNASADERVFKGLDDILMSQTAPPAVKAAAIRVLDRLSQAPQSSATTKGQPAAPKVTLEAVTVLGRPAIKATLADPVARPGVAYSMTLDTATGDLLETGSSSPDLTYTGSVTVRELVAAVPADFLATLGAQRVHKEIQQ